MSDIEAKVARYIELNKKRNALKAEYDSADIVLKDEVAELDAVINSYCNEHGLDSFKTKCGSVSRRESTLYWTSDWEAMYDFIKEEGEIEFLTKKLHQGNLKQFMLTNPDVTIPGLKSQTEYKLTVKGSKND